MNAFADADTLGSLIVPEAGVSDESIERFRAHNNPDSLFVQDTHARFLDVLREAEFLTPRYHVVVTNPPYMGGKGMNELLAKYLNENYTEYKSDLFAAFIVRCCSMATDNGYLGFMTPYVWMFIKSYEELRSFIYKNKTIKTLIQLEYSAFEQATVPLCVFVLRNNHAPVKGRYFRLTEFRGGMEVQRQKTLEAIANHNCGYYFETSTDNFAKIPGSPVAYWVGEKFTDMFKGDAISTIADTRSGMSTTDNIRFLRFWYEIDIDCACFTCESLEDASNMSKKWFPYNKGGSFRKWYGNKEFVVNWGRNGEEIKYWVTHNPQDPKTKSWSRRIFSKDKFFKKGLTWSDVSTGAFSARHIENGYIFDSCAPMMFCNEEFMKCMLAYINTNMFAYLLKFLCPTIHYNCGSLSSAPCPSEERLRDEYVAEIVDENISLSRADWDSFETSWDFKCHPLVRLARKG